MAERESTIELPTGRMEINRIYLPIIHALLPGQDEETYTRFFEVLLKVGT